MRQLVLIVLLTMAQGGFADQPHWNQFRGPDGNGISTEKDRVFVHFGSQGIACLDRQTGAKRWERRDLRVYQPVRQGSSPIVDDKSVYVAYDGTDQQFFVALDKETGETRWKKERNVDTDWEATLRARGLAPKEGGGKPNDNKKIMAKNSLNASFIASPAVADESLILRSTTHLYCLTNGFERTAEQVAADESSEEPKPKKTSIAVANDENADWEEAYAELLAKNAAARKKVESGQATKEQVIAWMKQTAGGKAKAARTAKPGARPGSVVFYAIVIGELKSKDIELGELTMDVDYVIGDGTSIKKQIVGKRIKLVGVAGQFLDNLLQIKRGETIKVRTGDYNPDTKKLGFGHKFQVLERTSPFKPEDFGVPPDAFRGFRGELVGNVVEAIGYEVLLAVTDVNPADGSQASDASSIQGKRIRIAGFYNDHRNLFADLHVGDAIRVGAMHRNPSHDALEVTDVLEKIED